MRDDEETTLSLHAETLVVAKRSVPTGRVRVSTRTETEEALAEALIETESVEVTRVPVGKPVEAPPPVRTEGDLTIVPVLEEVLVVEKRLVLKEEIHIRRTRRQERIEVPATVRRQHAIVERETLVPPHARPATDEGMTYHPARNATMTDLNSTYETTGARSTVSAFFDDRAVAEAAVARLTDKGVPASAIRLTEGATGEVRTEPRGFFELLADFFMPNEDRYAYAEGLARGGYLVSVTGLSGSDYDLAVEILDDEGAIDLDARSEAWRAEGWTGYDPVAVGTGAAAAAPGASYGALDTDATGAGAERRSEEFAGEVAGEFSGEESIPVVEERLRVGKRDISHGRVRVRSYVVEEPVSEEVELREDRVFVERRPVDRALTDADDAFRERTIEAEEHAEAAVVSKEARVVEEIGIRREHESHRETVSDTVRRTEVEIEDDRDAGTRDGIGRTSDR